MEGQLMEEIINVFPNALRPLCRAGFQQGLEPEELRLRIGRPVMVLAGGKEKTGSGSGAWFPIGEWGRQGRGMGWRRRGVGVWQEFCRQRSERGKRGGARSGKV